MFKNNFRQLTNLAGQGWQIPSAMVVFANRMHTANLSLFPEFRMSFFNPIEFSWIESTQVSLNKENMSDQN